MGAEGSGRGIGRAGSGMETESARAKGRVGCGN